MLTSRQAYRNVRLILAQCPKLSKDPLHMRYQFSYIEKTGRPVVLKCSKETALAESSISGFRTYRVQAQLGTLSQP